MKTWIVEHKKFAVGIGAGIIAIAVILVLMFTVFLGEQPLTVGELLDLGEKYLLELDYEQALVQFLAVIEIEPMNARAYIGAAEAYLAQGETDKAVAILENGLERTGDEEVRRMLSVQILCFHLTEAFEQENAIEVLLISKSEMFVELYEIYRNTYYKLICHHIEITFIDTDCFCIGYFGNIINGWSGVPENR